MRVFGTVRLVAIIGIIAVVFVCVLVVAFIFLTNRGGALNPIEAFILQFDLARRSAELERPAGTDPAIFCFTVEPGDTAATIAQRLIQQGFSIDADLFRNYVRYQGIDARLQAGTFAFSRTMNITQIAYKLANARGEAISFRVLEGWRLEEIAELIDQTAALPYRGPDFLALTGPGAGSLPGPIGEFAARAGVPAGRSLEGFLFPDTYSIPACGTVQSLVERMLQNFDTRVTDSIRSAIQARGLTLYQGVTLASIIQREAIFDDERPMIAGVYLNRLANGAKAQPDPNVPTTLDADPTIQYALGKSRSPNTWWPPLTQADYRGVSSPYNTYLNRGLPPGPIANPGLASIEAVANAIATPYNYFRACPGSGGRHIFSVTFAEHSAACG